ncbi:hypothetical protein SPRG_00669 [Saprolegnia parasitica CBS 223.65]|uniref:Lebercilin domain-containing protein n=1 Tax=Saprolegnia parasitica (strain CBS 223.65) TaxID=695850 RepID=A0A067D7G5_SAPPC|nr:hypothetical protein SPRG_00669 [Saprolegnia parasitica CBS 223.65]KDO34606.1 hypothetical protein SPRG_00669 [Saprolegnia parasitica CBS 223.65]|eukprot:XP_012194283.1 hypothetical protein SPRG_00669 [Saprolegnia parasitica CBS 223.65]
MDADVDYKDDSFDEGASGPEEARASPTKDDQTRDAVTTAKKGATSQAAPKKETELQLLQKKIGVYRKANETLRKELESLHSNDALVHLENKAREKQLLIEKLVHENRYLANLQRTQAKRIEELEALKEHFPAKHHSVMEELRVCKETFRMYKEREKAADERSAKLHQQVVDLTQRNKSLAEKIKAHENYKPPADSTATKDMDDGREDELLQLQARVAQLEKTKRIEKAKYDRIIKACEDQLDECKREMESFQTQLLDKEKELRLQVVQLKKLKRTLRELVVDTQTNQQLCSFLQGASVNSMAHRIVGPDGAAKKVPMPPPTIASDKRPVRIQQSSRVAEPRSVIVRPDKSSEDEVDG